MCKVEPSSISAALSLNITTLCTPILMIYAQDRCLRVKSSQTSFVLSIFVHIIVSGKHHKHMLGKYSILNCVFLNLHCLYLMSGLFWRCSHLPTMVCHMWPKFLLAFFPVPDDILNPKKKVFETVQADLLTSAQCVPTYKGVSLRTAAGELKATTLAAATIR